MLIFIDNKAPNEAKQELARLGEVVNFQTRGICYEAISGHPDIFLYQHPAGLIIAPNTPEKYKHILQEHGVDYLEGESPVGAKYPFTAHYNALYTPFGVLHNHDICDPVIQQTHHTLLNCKQGYVRCNTILLGDRFFTSDRGIGKALTIQKRRFYDVDPQGIELQGYSSGFFGGCTGVYNQRVYICGAINRIKDYPVLVDAIHAEGFEIIELYNGPIVDVGCIFFLYTK